MSVILGSQTPSVLDYVLTSAQNMHCFIPIGLKRENVNQATLTILNRLITVTSSNKAIVFWRGCLTIFANLKKSLQVYLQVLI